MEASSLDSSVAALIRNRSADEVADALAGLIGQAVRHEGTCLLVFYRERAPEVLHHTLEPAGATHYLDRYRL